MSSVICHILILRTFVLRGHNIEIWYIALLWGLADQVWVSNHFVYIEVLLFFFSKIKVKYLHQLPLQLLFQWLANLFLSSSGTCLKLDTWLQWGWRQASLSISKKCYSYCCIADTLKLFILLVSQWNWEGHTPNVIPYRVSSQRSWS